MGLTCWYLPLYVSCESPFALIPKISLTPCFLVPPFRLSPGIEPTGALYILGKFCHCTRSFFLLLR